ncbi:MAG: metallophosphoesterase [Planctomycetaceae bacterium]|nr:metallophosphoesterase [Planctomycetaceae bacterium]
MPLHVAPLSRRSFLAQGAAAAAGLTMLRSGWGADAGANPHLWALLSDTHVPNSPEVTSGETNMTNNLRQVVREVTALKTRPAGVIINGDCAYLKGLPADYANLAQCVAPLSDAGLPLHVTMGNHDDRGPLYDALKSQKPERPLLESKHVTIIESPHANWFLLDTLTQVDVVTGEIGAEQREWLAKALAARPDKPALVMAHHTPQFDPPAEGKPWGGIKDTAEFMDLLGSHKHVKAFLFGHSHNWTITRRGNLQLINLPPVAYVFAAGKPNGWVLAEVRENGLTLSLRTIDPAHKQNGELVNLTWE